jgi:hypothetical protein
LEQTEAATAHKPPMKPRPQWWHPGQSGNPGGIRISTHALKLFHEIAVEIGGADALTSMDAALLLQACRLLVRSTRLKDHDAAIRMSSEARRTLEGLRRRCAPAGARYPTHAQPFGSIVVSAQAEAAPRRAAELAADAAEAAEHTRPAGESLEDETLTAGHETGAAGHADE